MKRSQQVGEWIILKFLGSGGQARVYSVKKLTGETGAIKIFNINRKKQHLAKSSLKKKARFDSEVKALQELKGSPNIIQIFESGINTQIYYYIMEKADYNLNKHVKMINNMEQVFNIFSQIIKGLKAIHTKGYVYRDLKPQNILIKKDVVKLSDFGITINIAESMRLTSKEERVGSYYFMAPEFEEGRFDNIDFSSDYYPLGKIFYFLITKGTKFSREKFTYPEFHLASIYGYNFSCFDVFFRRTITQVQNNRYKDMKSITDAFEMCKQDFILEPILMTFGISDVWNVEENDDDSEPNMNLVSVPYYTLCDRLEIELFTNLLSLTKNPFAFIEDYRDGESFSLRGIFFESDVDNLEKLISGRWEIFVQLYHEQFDDFACKHYKNITEFRQATEKALKRLLDSKNFKEIMNSSKYEIFLKKYRSFQLDHGFYFYLN
ncbi:MAG: Serine/threonine-protein kinase StkP [Candidatus Heimdallarchaeota archaeon LC_3]|nr:MAG: Serine/threonine-protein kinase StkP [Candidatus Heimdallarchaeota archaeon LC_3]